MTLQVECFSCKKLTPVEYMNFLDDGEPWPDHVSAGIVRIAKVHTDDGDNRHGLAYADICDFCLRECQICGKSFLQSEGFEVFGLSPDGMLNGDDIVWCAECEAIEFEEAERAVESDARYCLSNTTNLSNSGDFRKVGNGE